MEKRLFYVACFITPLAVRIIPELRTSYPIGWDTPSYMYLAKVYSQRFSPWHPFYQILGLVYLTGVDIMVFMKVYPTLLYAFLILVFSVYVHKRLGWEPFNTLVACFLLSFSPVMLRMSWDLHRQNFALLVFFASLFFIDPGKGSRDAVVRILLLALLGMLHELVFGILVAVLVYNVVVSAVRRDRGAFNHYALSALIPVATYLVSKLPFTTSVQAIFPLFSDQYSSLRLPYEGGSWANLDWWLSLIVLAYGLIIPLAALGVFNHRQFTPWTAITFMSYATAITMPFFSFNLPDRWLFLAAPPVTVYAVNALTKFRINLKVIVAVTLVSVQAISMLGLFPAPLSVYAGQHYGSFTDTMLASSTDQRTVDALHGVAAWLNTNTPTDTVVAAPFELCGWALYYAEDIRIVRCDTLDQASELARSGDSSFYLLWYTVNPTPQQYRPVYHHCPLTLYQYAPRVL